MTLTRIHRSSCQVLDLLWHRGALGEAPVTVPSRAPLLQEALPTLPLAIALCNSHPPGPVLLTSSPAGAQRWRGPALRGPVPGWQRAEQTREAPGPPTPTAAEVG